MERDNKHNRTHQILFEKREERENLKNYNKECLTCSKHTTCIMHLWNLHNETLVLFAHSNKIEKLMEMVLIFNILSINAVRSNHIIKFCINLIKAL
jgi:hypothetical protein